jgi:hypothetical protein
MKEKNKNKRNKQRKTMPLEKAKNKCQRQKHIKKVQQKTLVSLKMKVHNVKTKRDKKPKRNKTRKKSLKEKEIY